MNRINRRPVDEESSEATYHFYVICNQDGQSEIRERLVALLEAANYPVRDVDQHAFGQLDAEIEARLYATSVEAHELDDIVAKLEVLTGVQQAFWNASSDG